MIYISLTESTDNRKETFEARGVHFFFYERVCHGFEVEVCAMDKKKISLYCETPLLQTLSSRIVSNSNPDSNSKLPNPPTQPCKSVEMPPMVVTERITVFVDIVLVPSRPKPDCLTPPNGKAGPEFKRRYLTMDTRGRRVPFDR